MTESKIEKHLEDGVHDRGGMCIKLVCEGRRGFPDRTVLWPTGPDEPISLEFIELKKPGGVLSKQQENWLEALDAMGYNTLVLSSVEEVDAYFGDL